MLFDEIERHFSKGHPNGRQTHEAMFNIANHQGNAHQNCEPLWKTAWRLLKKVKMELPYGCAIPLLGIYAKVMKTLSKGCLPSQVYCSIIHNSQGTET